jgi:hypothetical protein
MQLGEPSPTPEVVLRRRGGVENVLGGKDRERAIGEAGVEFIVRTMYGSGAK